MTILIAESGSGYGGTAKYLCELLSVMDRSRYDIQVLAAREGPFITKMRAQGVPILLHPGWRFPWGESEASNAKFASYAWYLVPGVIQLIVLVPFIAVWLKRRRIGLVHLNNEILSHLPLLLASRLAGVRVVCHLHGWRPFTKIERWAVGCIDEFICISEAGAQYYREALKGRRVIAIPNGILLNSHADNLDEKRKQQRLAFGLKPEERRGASSVTAW